MPAKLVAITSDLFLQSRFQELARSLNIEVVVLANVDNGLPSSSNGSTVVVLDLASSDYDAFKIARQLRSTTTTLLGYYPHVKADLKRRAEEAGFDHVVINRDLIPRLYSLLVGENC